MSGKRRLGKYYHIKSRWNGLVLEVQGALDRPMAPVVTAEPLDDLQGNNDHQLWWTDHATGATKSKLNSYCLDLKDDMLVVHPYVRGNSCQKWMHVDGRLQMQDDFETVLTIHGDIAEPGAPLVGEEDDGRDSQRWDLEHRPAQYFYVRSQMDELKVLDIMKSGTKPGAKVILYQEDNDLRDNQMWYEDKHGILRTKLNGYVIDTSVEKFATMMPYDKDTPKQQWALRGNTVANTVDPTDVLTMRQGRNPANPLKTQEWVTSSQFVGSIDQQWFFEYIPDQSLTLNHGGNGKEFIIRNKMNGLVLELKGGQKKSGTDVVTSYRQHDTDNDTRQQLFYVDEPTGTIRSAATDLCLDIPDNILGIRMYDPYNKNQQWKMMGNKMTHRTEKGLVLEVFQGSMDPGANVVPGQDEEDDLKQLWEVQHVPARQFLLSHENGKVLDIMHADASAGGTIILFEKNTPLSPNQLWYEDERGYIRSKLNGYVPDASGKTTLVRPLDPANRMQHWLMVGDRIQNKHDRGQAKATMPPLGKYFIIRSKLNSLVLELEAGKPSAGTPVVTWSERSEKEGRELRDCQLWYRDDNTDTIRNKLNGYCLDLKDTNALVANPFQDFRENQLWELDGEKICKRKEKATVLGVDASNTEPGATVVVGKDKGHKNQRWLIESQPARFFTIKSQMHGKLLDVLNCDPTPGVPVVMYHDTQCKRDNQLWYEDQNGIIRSKLSEFALDASGENICMQPYSAQNPRQQWLISGDIIRNKHDAGEVLDILGRKKQDSAYVGAFKFHGKPNQRWSFAYLGEGNTDSLAVKMVKAPVTFTKKLFKK